MTQMQTILMPDKFQNAEQMWFWFLYSKSLQNTVTRAKNTSSNKKICELVDVETLITKLYLCGKLTDEQIMVMKEYGDKHRAPHQYIWRENHDAAVWRNAMDVINTAAQDKGWIE